MQRERGSVLTNSWVELNRPAFNRNVRQLAKATGERTFVAVIKSNAYGHGLQQLAQACQKHPDVDWVATAGEEEALKVRQFGCRKPILVLSYYNSRSSILRHIPRLRLPLYSREQATILNSRRLNIPLHLKINTGTSRLGLKPEDVPAFCSWLKRKCPSLQIEGVWSHFARAEEEGWATTELQRRRLAQAVQHVRDAGYRPRYVHVDCSAPTIRRATEGANMVRVGLSLYGMWPSQATRAHRPRGMALEPILTWKTRVAALQRLEKGEGIGYSHAYRCPKPSLIATLPVGYWEGYRRAYQHGYVLIRGQRCPIRGRICMNLMMVDVSRVPNVRVGDEAVLLGKQHDRRISAEDLAQVGGTINYEVTTGINPQLHRAWTS